MVGYLWILDGSPSGAFLLLPRAAAIDVEGEYAKYKLLYNN